MLCLYDCYGEYCKLAILIIEKQRFKFAKLHGLKSCFAIIKGENIMLHFKSKGLGCGMLINLVKDT